MVAVVRRRMTYTWRPCTLHDGLGGSRAARTLRRRSAPRFWDRRGSGRRRRDGGKRVAFGRGDDLDGVFPSRRLGDLETTMDHYIPKRRIPVTLWMGELQGVAGQLFLDLDAEGGHHPTLVGM